MLENLFVLLVLFFSAAYIVRRLNRMQRAHKRKESACGACSSGTCGRPAQAVKGETSLPLSGGRFS